MSEKYFQTIRPSTENHRVFHGHNFMTPTKLSYTKVGDYEAELSRGKGIWSPRLYGVTVAKDGEKIDELCDCFQERKEAEAYITSLADSSTSQAFDSVLLRY